jgi:hypothetical protein
MKPTERVFFEAEPNSSFCLRCELLGENVPEAMNYDILSKDTFRDFIRSRDELSASGNDGISSSIMKTGGPKAVKLMRHIIKATI